MNKKLDFSKPFWRSVYARLNARSGGVFEIFADAIRHFTDNKAGESAASIAFYAFFSLFPLLLVAVSALSKLLEDQADIRDLLNFMQGFLPISQQVIARNIEAVIEKRGAFNLLAAIGFIWSASGVFRTLAANMNRAWPQAFRRSTLRNRILALVMVLVLIGLLLLSFIASTSFDLLSRELMALTGAISSPGGQWLWGILSRGLPFLIRVTILWSLYRWVPAANIRTQAAW